MKRASSPLWIGFYLLLVFLSGTLVGAFGHRLYSAKGVNADSSQPRPRSSHEAARQRYVREMETKLKLDEQQRVDLIRILDEFRGRYRSARDKIEPEMKQIQSEQRQKIRQMLREEQRADYDKMLEELDRKREASGRTGGF